MLYEVRFSTDIEEIINLIKDSKIDGDNGALNKFNTYLHTIQPIGAFNIQDWPYYWRRLVWDLGILFKKINPTVFLEVIDKNLSDPLVTNKEVIEFLRSEITFNYLPNKESKAQVEKLIEKYPLNAEFRNTYSQYLFLEDNIKEALIQIKLARKIDPTTKEFIQFCFQLENGLINKCIKESNYQKGKDLIEEITNEETYSGEIVYLNVLVDKSARLEDHMLFQEKLKKLEGDFILKIGGELEKERTRVVEILGFFSAIVAFILTTISIGQKFTFVEAIYFVIALGLILILFTTSLSVLFSTSKKRLLQDVKFWILAIGLFLQLGLIIFIQAVGKFLNTL